MKVIYSRYNRFRLPQFQIETQILREKKIARLLCVVGAVIIYVQESQRPRVDVT